MRKVRVAHLITRLCKGGAQENTFHTVRLANRERYEVDLVSGPTYGSEGTIEPLIAQAGVEIIREPSLTRNISPLEDWRALKALTLLFKERRYDIVHTHTSKAGYIGRLAARRAGVPILVHTPHGHIFHGYFRLPVTRLFVMLERHAARFTDRIIALTPRGVEEHLEQGIGRREQYVPIFSGIDLSPYDTALARREEMRRELGLRPTEILVGGVGRLEPVKGFAYLIQAARVVLGAAQDVRFILAGDGSLRPELTGRARPLGDRFRMLGLRNDVPDLMAAMDLFVLPSVNEGMGRVLLEAGAAGCPAVATAVGGVPDIVNQDETGVLVEPGSAKALADAILALVNDPEKRTRLGQAARKTVVPAYGLERMVARLEALYEELIREKRLDA